MTKRCPECGSRDLKLSHRRGLGELLRGFFGYYAVRCSDCRYRFEISVWSRKLIRYAHCPKCLRMDLTRWNLEHYIVPFWTKFKLNLGAQPFRCETCRCNFASFRPRGERFSWRKQRERGLLGAGSRSAAAAGDSGGGGVSGSAGVASESGATSAAAESKPLTAGQ
jgi:hypothetical protein